ncbi:MAG: LysR family transcriptional regulator [Hyphomonadaceae bacterium]|jgi:DNA-binding transcriptional LysR family regulator|nr:LysR family transcriptional regulator [Hyphomonadaceae bacterium]
MLNTRQLVTFYWSARLGSFTAAAKRLHTTQSVVSMRIRELERELGVELFDRRRRAAALSARGQKLLGYAEELLRLSSEARESVVGDPEAPETLRLGVAEVVSITWLPRLIRSIHARFPKIRVELDEALTGDLLARLREGSLDLVLAPGTRVGQRLAFCSLGHVEFAWMASPALRLPRRHLGPRDLQEWPIIALSRESFHHAAIEEWFASGNARCRRIDTCKSTGIAASLAAAGLGLTFLPVRCYRREIADGHLRIVKTRPATPPVEFIAVSSTDSINPFVGGIAALAAEVSDFDKRSIA